MSPGEFARARGAGREGRPTARPVSGPPHQDAPPASGSDSVMASDKSARAWEAAYRQYGRAWETTARSRKGDPAAAREMASASWAVAAAWRQIAAATTLPWWTLAAIESAAAAFEAQARECEARDGKEGHDRG
ncbi:MAG: hypothetical protein ACREX8_03705 [Gammaproteobacteria bacterium]